MKQKLLFLLTALMLLSTGNAWGDVIETVGESDCSTTDLSASSTPITLANGKSIHYVFNQNRKDGGAWNNMNGYHLIANDGNSDIIVMRPDAWENVAGSGDGFTYSWSDWDAWRADMDGSVVDMYVSLNGTSFSMTATITGKSKAVYTYTYNKTLGGELASLDIRLSVHYAYLQITTADIIIYERGTTNAWATADVGEGGWSVGAVTEGLAAAGGKLSHTVNNGGYTVTKAISPTSNYVVSMTASGILGSTGRADAYNFIAIGGVQLRVDGQSQTAQVFIDGVAQGSTVSAARNASYTFTVLINQKTGNVTYSVSGGATIASAAASTSTAISNVSFGYYKSGKVGDITTTLTSINITEEEYSAPTANYTVHFQDNNGTKVKEDEVRNGEVGATVGANADDKASFIADGNKYVYSTDGGGTTVTNDGSAEFTVTYTKYVSTSYTVKAQVSGSDLTTLTSGTAYLDGSTTEYWSKYIQESDQWYVADEATYGAAITAATTNVAFTATDDIDYFFEFESMSNSGTILGAIGGAEVSNGDSRRFGANGKKWTTALAGGKYTLNIYCHGNNGKSVTLPMYYSDADGSNEVYIGEATACNATTWGLKETTNVVIPEGKALCFYNNSSYTHNFIADYITLTRTADATVSGTIASSGYSSLATPYGLDFAKATGLTAAFVVSEITKTAVRLTSVDELPAGSGVILKGTPGATYSIPVKADASYDGTNKLHAAVTAYDCAANEVYILQGGLFHLVTAASTVPAGKAYLLAADVPNEARSLIISDEEDPTAISAIEAAESEAGALKDGKYLIGNKVVLVKNGVKYSANGQILK